MPMLQPIEAPTSEEVYTCPAHLLLQIYFPKESITTIGVMVKDEIMIGRADEVDRFKPDVDLLHFGALERGVSRHHAKITRTDNQLYIADLKSKNGTQLNDETLEADKTYLLHDGDMIKCGQLAIMVRFVGS